MVGKYKVVTLCGSTRFKDAFMETQKRLTLEGNIVISVGLFGHSGDDEVWTEGTKEMLDDIRYSRMCLLCRTAATGMPSSPECGRHLRSIRGKLRLMTEKQIFIV